MLTWIEYEANLYLSLSYVHVKKKFGMQYLQARICIFQGFFSSSSCICIYAIVLIFFKNFLSFLCASFRLAYINMQNLNDSLLICSTYDKFSQDIHCYLFSLHFIPYFLLLTLMMYIYCKSCIHVFYHG